MISEKLFCSAGEEILMNFDVVDRDLLFAILEEVRDAVLITDCQLDQPGPTIIYANPVFCEMTGYTLEELVGETPRLLQGPATDPELMKRLKRQLEAGEPFFGETVNYRKSGTPFSMEWSIRAYPNRGQPRYFIAVQRDVTALRDLEQQRRQLQALADIQNRAGTAGLNLQTLREQVAQIGLAVTGADGAAVEEAVDEEMVYTAAAGTAHNSVGLKLPIAGSLSGACYRDRQSIHCSDTHADPRVARIAADRVGFRSGLLVPLIHENHCFGVLKVYSRLVNAFSDNDLDMLSMASRILASSLNDAQRFKRERERRKLLVDSLPLMISFIDDELRYREVNAQYTRRFDLPAERIVGKPVAEILGERAFAASEPYMLAALRGEDVVFETYLPDNEGSMTPLEVNYIPLRDAWNKVLGFYALIRDISDRKRAERDHLTQTYNRAGFDVRLKVTISTAKRYQRPLALIFLDLDHFKSINDRYGHAVGDQVLRDTAQILREEVRESDVVCRWGGEEFAILAPETALEEARRLSERLRHVLDKHSFPTVGKVTASLGIAELAEDETEKTFISRADQALYAAKAAGRNRVESLI